MVAIRLGMAEHELFVAGDAAAAANVNHLESIRALEMADRRASLCLQSYVAAVRDSSSA